MQRWADSAKGCVASALTTACAACFTGGRHSDSRDEQSGAGVSVYDQLHAECHAGGVPVPASHPLRTPRAILATDAAAAGARRQYEHELMMRKFLQAQCSCAGSRLLVHERASKLMGPGAAAGQIFALQRPSQPQQVLVMEPHAKMRLSQRPKLFLRRCSNSLCRSTRLLSGSRRQRAQRALGPPRTALRCWSTTSLGSLGKL